MTKENLRICSRLQQILTWSLGRASHQHRLLPSADLVILEEPVCHLRP